MRILPSIAARRLRALGGGDEPKLRCALRLADHMGEQSTIRLEEALDVLDPGGSPASKERALHGVIGALSVCGADVALELSAPAVGGVEQVFFTALQVAESEPELTQLRTVGANYVDGQTATVQRGGKPLVRIFLSYSAKDEHKARDLWNRLQEFASIDRTYQFVFWDFKQFRADGLLPGDVWHQRTSDAIRGGDLGIFAVSRHFLSSGYIHEYELPAFVERNAAIPVLLESIDLQKVDLKGLDGRQVFRFNDRAFDRMRGEHAKNVWVQDLRDMILRILERRQNPAVDHEDSAAQAKLADLDGLSHMARLFGRTGHLPGEFDAVSASSGSQVDAVDHLVEWTRTGQVPLAAVLGEYGTGKTITCQAVMREIQLQRDQGATDLPEPMYFDLRNVSGLRQREIVPDLIEILDECIQRGWTLGDTGHPHASELLTRSKSQQVLFIVDGLDEALVHLTSGDGTVFTRELLRLRPPREGELEARDAIVRESGRRRELDVGPSTKVILSCRTHYFRSVAEQYGQFTGQHREVTGTNDFEALLLLPFTEQQILDYLARAVPDRDAGQTFTMLMSLHDLSDLTRRPVTLKLVAQQISFIEQRRASGRPVHAADVYERVVEQWLERDKGKEQLKARDKLTLMARLAAWMWRQNKSVLDLGKIEDWLHEQLDVDLALRRRYGNGRFDPDVLEEDLRTATFLVRQDDYDGARTEGFRFAHTSFQEYFLARYLLDAVENDRCGDWNLLPSNEVLDFLGQLLEGHRDRATILDTLARWCHLDQPRTNLLVLRYALRAREAGYQAPALAGIDLTDGDLERWQISGTAEDPLDLSGARLGNVNLSNACLDFVDMSEAVLTDARLDRAVLNECVLDGANLAGASLVWAYLHNCQLNAVDLTAADLAGLQHLGGQSALPEPIPPAMTVLTSTFRNPDSTWTSSRWSFDGTRIATSNEAAVRIWDAGDGRLIRILGRSEGMSVVAWSPADNTRLLTRGSDDAVRVWDLRDGRQLHVFEHSGQLHAAAWSPPDGARILTFGRGMPVRIWDSADGRLLQSVPDPSVTAAAWSPDGRCLVTCGQADTRIWNVLDGQTLQVLRQPTPVISLAWSPDGTRLATGGLDCTRIWSTDNGQRLVSLDDSRGSFRNPPMATLGWSPDATRILSADDAGIARVWDAISGRCVFTIEHSVAVRTAEWSPDGRHILTFTGGRGQLWSAEDGQLLHVFTDLIPAAGIRTVVDGDRCQVKSVDALAWSPRGSRVLGLAEDGVLQLWDDSGKEVVRIVQLPDGESAAWSPSRDRLLFATSKAWRYVRAECFDIEGNALGQQPYQCYYTVGDAL